MLINLQSETVALNGLCGKGGCWILVKRGGREELPHHHQSMHHSAVACLHFQYVNTCA